MGALCAVVRAPFMRVLALKPILLPAGSWSLFHRDVLHVYPRYSRVNRTSPFAARAPRKRVRGPGHTRALVGLGEVGFGGSEEIVLTTTVAMVQPLSWVLWNSALMFAGAFGAGMLTLIVQVDDAKLKLMNLVGAGLMVGTALAVIIPEGTEAFYGAYQGEQDAPHGTVGLSLLGGFLVMLALDSVRFTSPPSSKHGSDVEGHEVSVRDKQQEKSIMYMPGFPTLLGILVHSAADGIAVGAAAYSENVATGALISLAIVMHKAPTAFGLSAFLLNSGWSWRQVRLGIFLFSVAAPVVAIGGYEMIGAVPIFSSPVGVAVCLLLSGGTFLYAACIHILPEALQAPGADRGHHHTLTLTQVAAISIGAIIPLVLSLSHSHDHGGDSAGHSHGAEHMHAHISTLSSDSQTHNAHSHDHSGHSHG